MSVLARSNAISVLSQDATLKYGKVFFKLNSSQKAALQEEIQKMGGLKLPSFIHQIEINSKGGLILHSLWEESTEASGLFQGVKKLLGMHLFEKGKVHLKAERKEAKRKVSLGKINEVSEKWVIPLSDMLGVVRNGVGLVMVLLLLTGTGPAAPAVLALALSFSILLIIQGTLFAFPQGTFAWGADGASQFIVVRSLGDVEHMRTTALKTFSGFLSFVEGGLWIALGIAGIVPALAGSVGILTFILFNVFFTGSFALMTGMGIRDYRRHKAFQKQLQGFLDNQTLPQTQRYKQALEWLRDSMKLQLNSKQESASKKELLNQAAQKIYRIQEQLDESTVAELENIDEILAKMDSQETQAGALTDAQGLVEKALKANEINLEYDKWTIRLGVIGFIVGGLVYNTLHFLGLEMIGQAADFAVWMPLNLGFLILDVKWVVPALVEGKFKGAAKEKLVDPVVEAFSALGDRICALGTAKYAKLKTA